MARVLDNTVEDLFDVQSCAFQHLEKVQTIIDQDPRYVPRCIIADRRVNNRIDIGGREGVRRSADIDQSIHGRPALWGQEFCWTMLFRWGR